MFLQRSFGWFRKDFDGTSIRARAKPVNPLWHRAWDAILAALVMFAAYRLLAVGRWCATVPRRAAIGAAR